MAKNLELKIQINNPVNLIEKATKVGARFEKELNQKDIYYRSDSGLLKLRLQNGRAELIQYKRDEKNPERWSEYYVLQITDKSAESFFEKLFSIEAVVEKTRLLYIYKKTRIHLDKVRDLGDFLELESVVNQNEDESKSEFDEVVKLLSLDTSKQIKKSYRDLILNGSV